MSVKEAVAQVMALYREYEERKLLRSFCLQPREEKKARLKLVIDLSAELVRIRAQSIFATGLGEAAIEAVIEGDYELAAEIAKDLSFEHERSELAQEVGPRWAEFRRIIQERG